MGSIPTGGTKNNEHNAEHWVSIFLWHRQESNRVVAKPCERSEQVTTSGGRGSEGFMSAKRERKTRESDRFLNNAEHCRNGNVEMEMQKWGQDIFPPLLESWESQTLPH